MKLLYVVGGFVVGATATLLAGWWWERGNDEVIKCKLRSSSDKPSWVWEQDTKPQKLSYTINSYQGGKQ